MHDLLGIRHQNKTKGTTMFMFLWFKLVGIITVKVQGVLSLSSAKALILRFDDTGIGYPSGPRGKMYLDVEVLKNRKATAQLCREDMHVTWGYASMNIHGYKYKMWDVEVHMLEDNADTQLWRVYADSMASPAWAPFWETLVLNDWDGTNETMPESVKKLRDYILNEVSK
jgi:hypothetical protein